MHRAPSFGLKRGMYVMLYGAKIRHSSLLLSSLRIRGFAFQTEGIHNSCFITFLHWSLQYKSRIITTALNITVESNPLLCARRNRYGASNSVPLDIIYVEIPFQSIIPTLNLFLSKGHVCHLICPVFDHTTRHLTKYRRKSTERDKYTNSVH